MNGYLGETRKYVFPKGEVYFITDGTTIKIGWSGAPELRMRTLQGSHPQPLRILGRVAGTTDDEKAFHRRFEHLRLHGEWFRSDPELLDFIENTCRPDAPRPIEIEIAEVKRELLKWLHNGPTPQSRQVLLYGRLLVSDLERAQAGPLPGPILKGIAHTIRSLEEAIG